MLAPTRSPTFYELFTPKLHTVLRENYGWRDLKANITAGLTVAIVASAIHGDRRRVRCIARTRPVHLNHGRLCSLGPGREPISRSAARPAPLSYLSPRLSAARGRRTHPGDADQRTVASHHRILRLGTFIKYIPYPVTVGFTAGIAVIISSGELADLFGLKLPARTGTADSKVLRVVDAAYTVNAGSRVHRGIVDRCHYRDTALASALAGLPGCRGGGQRDAAWLLHLRRRDDRKPLWRNSATRCRHRICQCFRGKDPGDASGSAVIHIAPAASKACFPRWSRTA